MAVKVGEDYLVKYLIILILWSINRILIISFSLRDLWCNQLELGYQQHCLYCTDMSNKLSQAKAQALLASIVKPQYPPPALPSPYQFPQEKFIQLLQLMCVASASEHRCFKIIVSTTFKIRLIMEGRYKNFNGWIYRSWYVMHTKINGKNPRRHFRGRALSKWLPKGSSI